MALVRAAYSAGKPAYGVGPGNAPAYIERTADVRKAAVGHGYNAATGEITDLVQAGVIDPAMVTRSALQNAASIAKNILTTEAIVAEAPEKDGHGGGMPDMSGMM